MRLALVCFYCLCVFVYVLYFIATMSFAGYFLPALFCMLSMLISDSRFDLVWFRLSCDHGWIRSGSVNVRKQQQQQQHNRAIRPCHPSHSMPLALIRVCVFVFFPFILDIKFVGRTGRGHTGGRSHRISHPPSFCGACLIFLARRVQPFFSLVDREVEFCVLRI